MMVSKDSPFAPAEDGQRSNSHNDKQSTATTKVHDGRTVEAVRSRGRSPGYQPDEGRIHGRKRRRRTGHRPRLAGPPGAHRGQTCASGPLSRGCIPERVVGGDSSSTTIGPVPCRHRRRGPAGGTGSPGPARLEGTDAGTASVTCRPLPGGHSRIGSPQKHGFRSHGGRPSAGRHTNGVPLERGRCNGVRSRKSARGGCYVPPFLLHCSRSSQPTGC